MTDRTLQTASPATLPADGATYAFRTIAGDEYQPVVIVDGVDPTRGFAPPVRHRATANSAGLTTGGTLYAAGDQLGSIMSLASVGGNGVVDTLVLLADVAGVIGGVRAWFFSQSVTLAADNAPFSLSDADAAFCVGTVVLPAPDSAVNNAVATAANVNLDYATDAGTLFVALQTLLAATIHFAAADDLHLTAAVTFSS